MTLPGSPIQRQQAASRLFERQRQRPKQGEQYIDAKRGEKRSTAADASSNRKNPWVVRLVPDDVGRSSNLDRQVVAVSLRVPEVQYHPWDGIVDLDIVSAPQSQQALSSVQHTSKSDERIDPADGRGRLAQTVVGDTGNEVEPIRLGFAPDVVELVPYDSVCEVVTSGEL